ncbi:tetratricopeptide repeat protein 31 [Candoia aspera]|uniref:tetratricopeptide repeat protein 31 n=1 Tax=Candoia aspera TaxID=51853 RepID=UPI002FD82FF4
MELRPGALLPGVIMARLAVEEEEEEEEDEEGAATAYARQWTHAELSQRCPDMNGEPCWYWGDDYSWYENWEDCSEEAEEEEDDNNDKEVQNTSHTTFCGFRRSFLCQPSALLPPQSSSQDFALLDLALPQKQQLTAEEAERNAELLVAEEERLKKKAEKKRVKKKRQKDRKRQERRNLELKAKGEASKSSDGQDEGTLAAVPSMLEEGPPDSDGASTEASPGRSCSRSMEEEEEEEEAEEELDLSSTFVSKARLKVGTQPPLPRKEKGGRLSRGRKAETEQKPELQRPELQPTPVAQSMVLADCGNETAKQGRYHEAVLLFTEAIKLNPQEHRFFGNRSFCYEKLQRHLEALCDAQRALRLQPGWPKGLFRQGKALVGLKRYTDAARTFQELLQLDDFRGDAAVQLQKCQIQYLLENRLGCSHPDWNVPPPEARLPPSGERPGGQRCPGSSAQAVATTLLAPSAAKAPVREWFTVWVGNLTAKVTQQVLLRYFQPFGPIDSIRRLPRKFCAFINYTCREAAEAAYAALQGAEVEGCKLVLQLKHPAHATAPPSKAAPSNCLSSWA